MKKFRVGMAAVLILGIVALFFVVNAFAQSASERLNCPSGALSIFDVEEGINVECVNALFATLTPTTGAPTDTPVPPTDTPIPPTDTPGHSNVNNHPVSADIAHTHNEQDLLEDVFGLPGAWHNGNSISYPWQTWAGLDADPLGPPAGPGLMENDIKHEGYMWLVVENADCPGTNSYGGRTENCITDFRLLTHAIGGARGANGRLHSYSMEMRICTPDLATCGILRTGGHGDFGPLAVFNLRGEPFGFNYVPLPDDPPEFASHKLASSPYRHHAQLGDQASNSNIYNWGNDGKFGWNLVTSFAFSNKDDWQGIDMNDPSRVELICPAADCLFNHSQFQVYIVFFNKLETSNPFLTDEIDGVSDGLMNFSGFVDRQGNLVSACSLGPDCIPLIMENVPVGEAIFHVSNSWNGGEDFDISPPGEFWIRFPN